MKLHMIRHAPALNPKVCYGHCDVAVESPAQATRDYLRMCYLQSPAPMWSSPALRCLEVARPITPQVCTDERLRELNFGAWEGIPWLEIPRAESDVWAANWKTERPPCGETLGEMQARVTSFLQDLRGQGPEFWLVTHAGVIRMLRHLLLGIPMDELMTQVVPHVEIITMEAP